MFHTSGVCVASIILDFGDAGEFGHFLKTLVIRLKA